MRKLFIFALAASAAFAQTPPPRLVTLNLAATDAQGHPVTDLTAAEIQITDQGKSVPVVAFRNDAARPGAAAPAAREYTNRPSPAVSHAQIILFDTFNLPLANRQPAVDQIVRSLEKLETSDSVYLYLLSLTGELVAVRGLPDAATESNAAATPWVRGIRAMLQKAVGPPAAVEAAIRRDTARRLESTYGALATLASRLAPLPGRKNILWLTGGMPCTLSTESGMPWDCRPILSQVSAKLEDANVGLSPVSIQTGATDPEVTSTFQQFVDQTGGKLYTGGDIERAVPEAIELGRSAYRLQFAPPANSWDGKVHKIRATSTRKGVGLLSRQTYTAEKVAGPFNEKEHDLALFQNPFDAVDLTVGVIVSAAAQPRTVHLRITLDPQELMLTSANDKVTGQLSLQVAAFLPDNKLQVYDPIPVNLNLTAEQVAKMTRDGMHLGNDVLIPEGVRKIRLLVVDRANKNAATVTIPIA